MKRSHWILFAALLVLVVYALATLWPHLRPPKVINTAGVSESEVTDIVEQLHAKNAFPGRMQPRSILQHFIKPWTRPHFAVAIQTQSNMRGWLFLLPYLDYPSIPCRDDFIAIKMEDGKWKVRHAPRPSR